MELGTDRDDSGRGDGLHAADLVRVLVEARDKRELSRLQRRLGRVPLDPTVCDGGENGKPIVLSRPDSAPAKAFRETARKVAAQVSIRNAAAKPLEIKLVKA